MLETAQTSAPIRGEFRHNKRRICKQSAKRVGQENDSAGNSWNTSNFNIWEDWSFEHLSGPGSELHQPFFNIMPGINILILHTENGFSIKCCFRFYMDLYDGYGFSALDKYSCLQFFLFFSHIHSFAFNSSFQPATVHIDICSGAVL